ncbi:Inducer of phenazine A [Micromonospora sp. NPDC047793]|uniref:Inducer of phenazine A n=1 Tax=unclassified Micromonospora TaxID=2617518 RepID=UPI001F1C52A6|nr:Inducer of phenazine A [Verrucosispora sp. SN26_14.1]
MSYVMHFHRVHYRSPVINTDRLGFRISHGADGYASAGGEPADGPIRLLAGSSMAMGIGATCDQATLASRLWTAHAPSLPWLNFAGRSHSSAQELLLFLFYRHLLPPVEEIVIVSGLNNLALARLPAAQRGDDGAFFNCGDFFGQMDKLRSQHRTHPFGSGTSSTGGDEPVRPLEVRIADAAALTVRHLESWKQLAAATDTRITFVLQPLATWVRETAAPPEKCLFDELDKISNFWELFGDIATRESVRRYAELLQLGCEKIDVGFLDINPLLATSVKDDSWLFVNRAHMTDHGLDLVARLLAEQLNFSS